MNPAAFHTKPRRPRCCWKSLGQYRFIKNKRGGKHAGVGNRICILIAALGRMKGRGGGKGVQTAGVIIVKDAARLHQGSEEKPWKTRVLNVCVLASFFFFLWNRRDPFPVLLRCRTYEGFMNPEQRIEPEYLIERRVTCVCQMHIPTYWSATLIKQIERKGENCSLHHRVSFGSLACCYLMRVDLDAGQMRLWIMWSCDFRWCGAVVLYMRQWQVWMCGSVWEKYGLTGSLRAEGER